MRKEKRNILIFVIVLLSIIIISYFIFLSGITNKIRANVQSLASTMNNNINTSELPIIDEVVNSSGNQLVNTDVLLLIDASSKYNINKVQYSFDLKNWKDVKEKNNGKKISAKLVFSKTMNKKVYIRVQNDHGYKSYAYETVVNIDKDVPKLIFKKESNNVTIRAIDNVNLSNIQYSNDKLNWDSEKTTGEEVTIRKENFKYKYIRVIDSAGNISKIKEIK